MKNDIYSTPNVELEYSLRYIYIKVRNVVGILNRIASLMRRKRYNIEDMSVAFDDEQFSHLIFAIDGRLIDVQNAVEQLRKLHDTVEARDMTQEKDHLFKVFYVEAEDFSKFPVEPLRIMKTDDETRGIFMTPLGDDTAELVQFLDSNNYSYRRRLVGLT
ncbi:ACT domain-containing protein [Candidatus Peregrinibacteria bacterium]|jgi:hypothetical protein|nr:ACT domain-containing protein [Candidatus Peregrinibacteria bacterium]MBT7703172.1 ACT domain-containing protein [Candidatus Peregrinibacteria bacterium]